MSPSEQTFPAGLDALLRHAVTLGASDVHLCVGIPPSVRVHGAIAPATGWSELTAHDTDAVAAHLLDADQRLRFDATREMDLAHSIAGVGRFRVNLYQQRGSVGAAFRIIPSEIRSLESLGLPPAVAPFAHLQRGLVLVTGPTGSGKTTTLASLVDLANRTRPAHIITIEDPIEYLHRHRRSMVNQREVGADTADFGVALRHALRQDPDIILVGELRDLETTQVALTAAETGHLVFATLHTRSAATTVDRLIDVFPAHQQSQVRTQLAGCLEGVVAQSLLPTSDGGGRTAVCEVMVASPAIRNLVREAKVHQITTAMQSAGELGMITFDQHLAQRYHEGEITRRTALEHAHHPDEFSRLARL
ncbi:MAG: type IV pilus twitching motility protein PilT [Nocardioides sp.]|nr:type IV pilus twitching motility protein PilT [Nocardioides sp.]